FGLRQDSSRRSGTFWNLLIPLGAILVIVIIWGLTIGLIRHERGYPLRGSESTKLNGAPDFEGLRRYSIAVAVLQTLIIIVVCGLVYHTRRQKRSLQADAALREQQLQRQA